MCACTHLHAPICLLHIESVDKELVVIEAEDPDVVYEGEQQEFMEANPVEDPAVEVNFANPDLQQGKHRFILNPESFTQV